MHARLRLFIHLLLAFNLVVIGLPAYSAAAPADLDEAQAFAVQDCPFHRASIEDTQINPVHADELAHDCCGPDCRCACASLSMLNIHRIQAPLTPLPAILPQGASTLVAVLYGNRLLRPPQA